MAEAGVDISKQRSKGVGVAEAADLVVTVCDSARESCPVMPGAARTIHAAFPDPPRLAREATTEDEAMPHFRAVRDQIRQFVEQLLTLLDGDRAMTNKCCDDSCCQPAPAERVHRAVREGYGKIAKSGSCGTSGGGCCGATAFTPEQLAQAIGYAEGDLAFVPDSANMGLSCGNPTAMASLRQGETVLDLGSGGGFDCFVAGAKVGASGRVIGVDMTAEMLSKARANIAAYTDRTGLANVEFRLGEIEALPVPDASVDVVISNCVLNLSPDKPRVWREIARVLKPGGRVAVSDLALLQPLPESVRTDIESLVGCVAGAVLVDDTQRMAEAAGLSEITLARKSQYIDSMADWQDPLYRRIAAELPKGSRPSDFVTSLDVTARK
jgi:SAM-dependent methyltransferase